MKTQRAEDPASALMLMAERAFHARDKAKSALLLARGKLVIYRELHPEYVGGMEFSALMKQIDEALKA